MTSIDYKSHWNTTYESKEVDKLGWYQEEAGPSLELIKNLNLSVDEKILIIGAGATTLVGELIQQKYSNLLLELLHGPKTQSLFHYSLYSFLKLNTTTG